MVSICESVSLKIEVARLTAMVSDLTDQLKDAMQHSNIGMEKGIFIWSQGRSTYVRIRDIVMIKAESNYSVIFLSNGYSYFTSHTLKYWVEKCDTPHFIRAHKSYVINY
jgi:DNA-binding LytR/AlgR family response regulator